MCKPPETVASQPPLYTIVDQLCVDNKKKYLLSGGDHYV
jgi:hypothetical protein